MPSQKVGLTQKSVSSGVIFHRAVGFLLLAFVFFDEVFKKLYKNPQFKQVRLNGCSTWSGSQGTQQCNIKDPNSTTQATITADKDYEVIYFNLVLSRQFARAYRTNHHRLEHQGRVRRNGVEEYAIHRQENSYIQGADYRWNVSFPHRVGWAKNVKKGDNISLELDYVKIFHSYRDYEPALNFASSGIIDFMIIGESDEGWMIKRIYDVKTIAFWVVLPIFLFAIYKSERGHIPLLYTLRLLVVGGIFLHYTFPFPNYSTKFTPEEYFGAKSSLDASLVTFFAIEVAMGLQIVCDNNTNLGKLRYLIIPLLVFGYVANWFARSINTEDLEVSNNAYYDGTYRFPRHGGARDLIDKSRWLGPGVCLLVGVVGPMFGARFSSLPIFLAYTMTSYTPDRHSLAVFSSWKFTRDLAVWVFGYFYLVAWGCLQSQQTNTPHKVAPNSPVDDEEHTAISQTK